MKKLINSLAAIFPFFRHGSFLVLAFLLFSLSSCFKQYYQTNTVRQTDSAALGNLQAENKHFIVHTPAGPFALKDVKVGSENLSGEKDFLNPNHDRLLNPRGETKNAMSRTERKVCTTEVHLYTDRSFNGSDNVTLSYNQINRMDVYGLDKKAIRASTIRGIVGVTLGVAAVIGVGMAAASTISSTSINISMGNMRWD